MAEKAVASAKKLEAKKERSVSCSHQTDIPQLACSPAEHILFLQRTAGNQAVERFVRSGVLQAKLKISQPHDKYEQEADRVANAVTQSQTIQMQPGEEKTNQKVIQTKASDMDLNLPIQRQVEEEKEEPIQASLYQNSSQPVQNLQDKLLQSRNEGSPLPEGPRSVMESSFGTDFGDVRIHRDSRAAEMARAINAKAFTSGKDIYFGEGRFVPGTVSGDQLLAHELTHVIQQRGQSSPLPVSRAMVPADGYPMIYRQVAPASAKKRTTEAGAKTASKMPEETFSTVMELKGEPELKPPISDFLDEKGVGNVNVRFGTLAEGVIKVKKSRRGYSIVSQDVLLTHSLFSRLESKPNLILYVTSKGRIRGEVGIGKRKGSKALVAQLRQTPEIFGLPGFYFKGLSNLTNKLENGKLEFGFENVPIRLGSAFSGTLTLKTINENITFDGSVDINVRGLDSGSLVLNRSEEGLITGEGKVGVKFKNVTGEVLVIWNGEVITGEGEVGYQGEKLSGTVLLKVMEKNKAEQLEREMKTPAGEAAAGKKAGKTRRKPSKASYVIFGDGDLTFAFNEWLNGTAHVIVDQKGFVTIVGKIVPQKEFELFPQKDYTKELFKVEARAAYGIPVVGNIFIFANVGMDAFAKLGPGKFYKIEVAGTYSTDPKKNKDFSIRGSLNVSAAAGLRLRGEAGAGLEVIAHDIKAGAGINGIAAIRGYAEATPIIGYREKGKAGEDKKGEFFIRGDLEIAAQPFLGLGGDLFVEVDSPWWSPLPDKKWDWPLGNREWPIGGSLGLGASMDYVFGSGQAPSVEFKKVDFSADKFLTDLYSDKARAKSGGKEEKKGKWKEKNTKGSAPPAPPGKKGDVKEEKPPKLALAKPKVRPGGPKKTRKPADPNARTAEGKSVKELKEKASKKGKKAELKSLKKGTVKEEPSAKDQKEKAHDEQLQKGLAALVAVTRRYTEAGASKEELQGAVKSVRRKFKVFKSIKIIDGVKTWDYKYVASDGVMKGPSKAIMQPNLKEAEKVKVGDYVYHKMDKLTLLVIETKVHTKYGSMVRAKAGKADKRKTSYLIPYNKYGEVWEILKLKKPTHVPFKAFGGPGEGGQVIIDKANLGSGTRASASASDKSDMGFGGKYKHLGHLVAKDFSGPGSYKSGNIVAMTEKTNKTKEGMRKIEIPVRNDIDNYAVYKYTVRPKDKGKPPKQIEVIAVRLFPSSSTVLKETINNE
ncbi:MAG: DUF4157 domain-containing protein [Methanosarcinaceae archaeon]